MATISQKPLFGWDQIEALGDLKRLQLVLENLPDEPLMKKLEQERDRGRDDYPIRSMWNALVSGVVFQHPTVEALLRELRRNAQLRQLCGFDLVEGAGGGAELLGVLALSGAGDGPSRSDAADVRHAGRAADGAAARLRGESGGGREGVAQLRAGQV